MISFRTALLVTTWTVGALATAAPCQDKPTTRWFTDATEAREAATQLGKPLLAVFRCEP